MAPTSMKPEHYDKQRALREPLFSVGQSSHLPDNVNLLLTETIFPQLISARLENPQLLSSELHPPLILVMDKQALYMPALPSISPFAELFKVLPQKELCLRQSNLSFHLDDDASLLRLKPPCQALCLCIGEGDEKS